MDPNSLFTPKFDLIKSEFGIKDPSWLNAKAYSIGQMKVVELPLVYRKGIAIIPDKDLLSKVDFVRTANAIISKCLIIRLADGKIVVRVLQIIPSFKHAKESAFDVSENSASLIKPDFDGYYMVRNWNESQIKNWRIANGKKMGGFLFQKRIHSPSSQVISLGGSGSVGDVGYDAASVGSWWYALLTAINNSSSFGCTEYSTSGDQPQLPENCITWTNYDNNFPDINLDDPSTFGECANAVNYQECFCQTYGLGCGNDGSGGGNGSGGGMFSLSQINTDEVTNPCLLNAINAIGSDGHKSLLLKLYQTYFNGDNNNFKIRYVQNDGLVNANNNQISSHTDINTLPDGTKEVVISINKAHMQYASVQYVSAVILHEITHAYLFFQRPNLLSTEHHDEFLNGLSGSIASSLKELYPSLSINDAKSLGLQGLEDIYLWPVPTIPPGYIVDPVKNDISLQKYGIGLQAAKEMSAQYFYGILGTPC